MKKCFAILMSLLILLISMQQGMIYVHFKLNQEYYAEYLCINKDKVELDCAGSCQLKKEIKNSSKDTQLEYLSIFNEVKLMKTDLFDFKITNHLFFHVKKQRIMDGPTLFPSGYLHRMFKPPIV